MKTDLLLTEIYAFDKATNRYMIEVALNQYTDIFNEWDPAPFKRRDLDSDLELYLEKSSEEIPLHYPVELFFVLPPESQDQTTEKNARDALNSYFSFKLYLLKKDLKKINVLILRYVFLGFLLLWAGTITTGHNPDTSWATVITEGIFIGGWVFLWEAVSLFFFSKREFYHRYRIYKRLLNAPVFFRGSDSL